MFIENQATFDTTIISGFNLMVGSGFSVLAKDVKGHFLPVGAELADEFRSKFEVDHRAELELTDLSTLLVARDRDNYEAYLRARFAVDSFDPRYTVLTNLPILTLFTTNIDDLFWRIYDSSASNYLNDVLAKGPKYKDKAAIDYFPLHGCINDSTRLLRFTSLEVASSFSADPQLWNTFRTRLNDAPTLFWGYSLKDAAALQSIYQPETSAVRTVGNKWIVLRPDDEGSARVEVLKSMDFQVIFAETEQLLDYLGSLAGRQTQQVTSQPSKNLAQYRVPTVGAIAQRPVSEFYLGAAPSWSDVYNQRIPQLAQFREAQNALNEGLDIAVLGIPASGKTTLLMQLASADVGRGPTLFPGSLTDVGAQRLLRALNGQQATVFVDTFCDDTSAWNTLRSATNVQVIGADREYNYTTVTHRVGHGNLRIVDMTSISDLDLSAIRASIPAAIRTISMVKPPMTRGTPSLGEFNIANTQGSSLTRRIRDAIVEYQNEDAVAAEMLLLVCYAHSCNVPLSMDMALGYWRDEQFGYEEVVDLVQQVGKLLQEQEENIEETDQDYFVARSITVSEAALEAATSSLLHKMLIRFHYNLSTARIARYDVFQRKGYSHRLVGRAFPSVPDAANFYDYLNNRDPSPYLLQQKALLLSSKKLYSDSFVAIEEAVSMGASKRRNWRIEATHAEILFNANFELAAVDDSARAQVDKAMRLLRQCYESDRRKSMHAFVYARKAIQYFDLFPDKEALNYAQQAVEWLDIVKRKEPYLSNTSRLTRQLEDRISGV